MKILSAIILICLLAGGGLYLSADRLLRTEVEVAEAKRGTAVKAVPGVVRVREGRSIDLRSEIQGRLVESRLELGVEVEEGDLLVRLDDATLRHEINRVQLEIQTEEALKKVGSPLRFELEELREEQARKEELYADGRLPRRELDRHARKIARLEDELALQQIRDDYRLDSLRNELAHLEEELQKTVVSAPESGTIVEIFAHPGEVLGVRSPVARLLSHDRIIEATLSEENFAGVAPGQPATVRFLSYGSQRFTGRVAQVLPAANPETQRYTIHLAVDMPDEMKVPGITGEVSILLAEREDTLLIPRRALIGREVFLIKEGMAKRQPVAIGFIGLNTVEILDGLREGDTVAVENLDRIQEGDRVSF